MTYAIDAAPAVAAQPANCRRHAHGAVDAGDRPRQLCRSLAVVGRPAGSRSGRTLWDFCGAVGEKGTKILVDRDQYARRPLVSRGPPELRRKPAADARRRRGAGLLGRGQGQAADVARRTLCRGRPLPALPGRRRRRRGRPCRRLPAQPAGNPDRHAGRRPRSAPSGHRPRRTSACRACSTASARSSPRCWSASMATGTTASRSIAWRRTPRSSRKMPSLLKTVVVPYLTAAPEIGAIANAVALDRRWRGQRRKRGHFQARRLRPSAVHHVLVAAPPACPSASSIATAACCCSTSRNTSCTATCGPATGCSTSPPAAG